MKIAIFIVQILLFSFQLTKGQDLALDDLKRVSIATSIDQADSILRIKGFSLRTLPKKDLKEGGYYLFEKNMTIGSLEMISVHLNMDIPNTYTVDATYDNEAKFYTLKAQCQKQPDIYTKGETNDNDAYFRVYFDTYWKYMFAMVNDNKYGMIYHITVAAHLH